MGSGSLVIAIAAGVAIAGRPSHWSTIVTVAIVLSALLVVLTVVGMAQARRMTIQRQRALEAPDDESRMTIVERGAAIAQALRGSIALVTLALLVLGAQAINV